MAKKMKPAARPQTTRDRILAVLKKNGVNLQDEGVALVGIAGYYRDTMGKVGENDVGIYDDAFFWITRDGEMTAFNGNVDPSRYYQGVATLKDGVWDYKKGPHGISRGNPYPAFRQAGPVKVLRYQGGMKFKEFPLPDTINIHKGGINTTSSAGCQTVVPDQWPAFKALGYMLLDRYGKKTFKYVKDTNEGDVA